MIEAYVPKSRTHYTLLVQGYFSRTTRGAGATTTQQGINKLETTLDWPESDRRDPSTGEGIKNNNKKIKKIKIKKKGISMFV